MHIEPAGGTWFTFDFLCGHCSLEPWALAEEMILQMHVNALLLVSVNMLQTPEIL